MLNWSAKMMAQAVGRGEIAAEALIEAHLARIDAVNPRLNAVVQLDRDQALELARAVDLRRASGASLPPLAGVPFTVKDSFDTAGIVSTAGTLGRRDHRPERDATVVKRLREAGAILLGKSNTPELTLSFETDNLIYGRTNNPYDLDRTPGGSSGGAAAIVASGGSAFDVGSDTSGSLRVPAHFCGVAALKPTAGSVPRTGNIIADDERTQIGPIARRVEDLALILPILEGPDGIDPMASLGRDRRPAAKAGRVALFTSDGLAEPNEATRLVFEEASRFLATCGLDVEWARPRAMDDLRQLRRADRSWIERLLEGAGTTRVHDELAWIHEPAIPGRGLPADELAERTTRFRSQMDEFMKGFDALICPVRPWSAPRHGDSLKPEFKAGRWYTPAFNLTGWPVATVRAGTAPGGLPIGVQVAARRWREDVAIEIAGLIEGWSGGWRPPPL
ncbi:MAG TPA: amidase [Allosphingosinicella sp.]